MTYMSTNTCWMMIRIPMTENHAVHLNRPCRFRQGRFTLQTVLRALRVDVAQVHEEVDHVALVGAVHAEQLVLVAVVLAQLADGHVAGEHALQVELLPSVGGAQQHVVTATVHCLNQIIYILCILQKHHSIASFLRSIAVPFPRYSENYSEKDLILHDAGGIIVQKGFVLTAQHRIDEFECAQNLDKTVMIGGEKRGFTDVPERLYEQGRPGFAGAGRLRAVRMSRDGGGHGLPRDRLALRA